MPKRFRSMQLSMRSWGCIAYQLMMAFALALAVQSCSM